MNDTEDIAIATGILHRVDNPSEEFHGGHIRSNMIPLSAALRGGIDAGFGCATTWTVLQC